MKRKLIQSPDATVGPLSRRTLIKQFVGTSAALVAHGTLFAVQPTPRIRVTAEKVTRIPHDFTGLSYESSQLSHPWFFSAENHDLIQFFCTLGDHGVLRLGGNMSEYTVWDPTGSLDGAGGETEGPTREMERTGSSRSAPSQSTILSAFWMPQVGG